MTFDRRPEAKTASTDPPRDSMLFLAQQVSVILVSLVVEPSIATIAKSPNAGDKLALGPQANLVDFPSRPRLVSRCT
jgi:hypothetical protein